MSIIADITRTIFPYFGAGSGPQISEGLQGDGIPRKINQVKGSTFDHAMQVSAWWACCRLLSETIASMPLECFKKTKDFEQKTDRYRLWRLLNFQPNGFQTKQEFLECKLLNLFNGGNMYSRIIRADNNPAGDIVALLPYMNSRMMVHLINGQMVYQYTHPSGNVQFLKHDKIWHVKLFGNGVTGLSPLQYAALSIGTALDSNNRASQLAASGGKTNGILMIDKELTPEQRQIIRRNFSGLVEGSEDELWVLEHNMKFERTSLSPQDAQLLESWRFSLEEICRFFGVPSILVNDTKASTAWGSGIQQLIDGFYKLTLKPHLTRLETSIERWLVPRKDWGTIKFRFNFDDLTRADLKTRMDAYNKSINSGVYAPNEARKRERLPPQEGGDIIYLNGSLRPAKLAQNATTPSTNPKNQPVEPDEDDQETDDIEGEDNGQDSQD